MHNKYKALLPHITKGCLADREGVRMYYVNGKGVLCSLRGTGRAEGYWDKWKDVMPDSCGAEYFHLVSADFHHVQNTNGGILNGGDPDVHTYDQWLCEELNDLDDGLGLAQSFPTWKKVTGVNSGEVFDVEYIAQGAEKVKNLAAEVRITPRRDTQKKLAHTHTKAHTHT